MASQYRLLCCSSDNRLWKDLDTGSGFAAKPRGKYSQSAKSVGFGRRLAVDRSGVPILEVTLCKRWEIAWTSLPISDTYLITSRM